MHSACLDAIDDDDDDESVKRFNYSINCNKKREKKFVRLFCLVPLPSSRLRVLSENGRGANVIAGGRKFCRSRNFRKTKYGHALEAIETQEQGKGSAGRIESSAL